MIIAASCIMVFLLTAYHVLRMNFFIALSFLAIPIISYSLNYFIDSELLGNFAFGSLIGAITPMVILVFFNFYWQSNMHDKNLRKSWDLDQH